ncbi:MAG: hypothetical protein COV29_02315 [Candidatus Yanofskybacteria bacterium CG10_big_fil_rev_8_21_14_0_10_36_16]|uniref:Proteasome subunit alpha n=1 Tax=Candidatus Yanofskybacteria bacterium CG10_big_fil_rev_8_21_14_0_10_36_16 TaxID=1975096 RepID=A0A2J0Q7Y7_9BACT|nr:MAG: hypothetical protein COV29_02315 [Candidatus Yanofskybacteria bacterium CG10_big_fil_rev_8_21_14_0_10_36_16]
MDLMIKFHSSCEKRAGEIRKDLKSETTPAFVISCRDGILSATVSGKRKGHKIYRMLDRSVFTGVGSVLDCKNLYAAASSSAKVQAHMERSKGDVSYIIENIVTSLSSQIANQFRNLYSNNYFRAEIAFTVIGQDPAEDEIWCVDCTGDNTLSSNFACLPVDDEMAKVLGDDPEHTWEMDMKTVFRDMVYGSLVKHVKGDRGPEVVVLDRTKMEEKKFGDVYKRLSQEQISNWLS